MPICQIHSEVCAMLLLLPLCEHVKNQTKIKVNLFSNFSIYSFHLTTTIVKRFYVAVCVCVCILVTSSETHSRVRQKPVEIFSSQTLNNGSNNSSSSRKKIYLMETKCQRNGTLMKIYSHMYDYGMCVCVHKIALTHRCFISLSLWLLLLFRHFHFTHIYVYVYAPNIIIHVMRALHHFGWL